MPTPEVQNNDPKTGLKIFGIVIGIFDILLIFWIVWFDLDTLIYIISEGQLPSGINSGGGFFLLMTFIPATIAILLSFFTGRVLKKHGHIKLGRFLIRVCPIILILFLFGVKFG